MDLMNQLSIFYISIHHINVLLITLAINVGIYVKAKKNQLLYSFLFLQGTIMLWMLAKILKTVSPTLDSRWFFVVLQYLSIYLLEVGFFEFSFIYALGRRPVKKYRIVLYIIAAIQFIIVATNPYHYLFYSRFDFVGDDFGLLFYVHTFIIYAVIIFGMSLCGVKLRKTIQNRRQYRIVSAAILFPFIANLLYILGITRTLIKTLGFRVSFDVTPIAFTMSLFIFLYAIYKYDFLDIMPIFKEEIIRRIQTAIMVTDDDGVVIECNNAALDMLGFEDMFERKSLSGYLDNVLVGEGKQRLIKAVEEKETFKLQWSYEGSTYEIHKKPYIDHKGKTRGYIYTIYDISDYIELKESINEKNAAITVSNKALEERINLSKELSRIAARNYFARELHDILGHSMTVAIKLLEVGKLSYKSDKTMAIKQLEEAAKVSSKGYTDLRKSIVKNFDAKHDFLGLKNDIKKIVKVLDVAGVECVIDINKEYGLLSDEETQVIKRFCQEGITNALKHGKATKVIINLEFDKEGNHIYVLNNGVKPQGIVKGSGLKGLDYRVSKLGGKISFIKEEEWFGLHMSY